MTRHAPRMIARLAALDAALRAAGHLGDDPAPVLALAYDPPAAVVPTWREGADRTAAQALIDGWDWTPRDAAAELREAAVRTLLASDEPLAQAVRAAVADLHTRLNDLESARGGRRQAEAEIVTRLVAAIETGAGEP